MTHRVPAFDIRSVPFSRRGSWMNLSPVIAAHETVDDIHLISHRTGMHAVLRLAPGTASEGGARWTTDADAVRLRWSAGTDAMRAVFSAPDTLRIRGDAGTTLQVTEASRELTPFTGTYLYRDPRDGSAVFTSYETGCRYRVTVIEGALHMEGAGSLGLAERVVIVTGGGDGSPWEIAIEEFESSRPVLRSSASFDACEREVEQEFVAYAETVVPWVDHDGEPSAERDATLLATYVLWSTTVAPAGFLRRESVLMSKHWMDKVWSWDHCFNAIALAPGLPDLALDQFLAPFDHQDATGALPDSIAHSERLYNFVKPPIHGWALARLREEGVTLTPVQVRDVYDKLARWTRFWLDERRVPGHALPHYQHGNDSGWDNATTFDRARSVESPDLAAFLLMQLDVLGGVAEELGEDASEWRAEAKRVGAGLSELWRGDGYVARSADHKQEATRSSLLPSLVVTAADRLPNAHGDAVAETVRSFLTAWGPATERPDSEHYTADGYWRGPIWAPSTMLIEDGLRRSGHLELADDISGRFRRLCENGGFAENFDAQTGEGLRDRAYTWTAAVYIILARDAHRRRGR